MEERRRRTNLTPLSGELREMVEWTPSDPTKERPAPRRRKERRLPTTRRGMILRGLVRLGVILLAAGGGVALVGGLIVWRGGGSAAHVLPLAYYFAAAGVGALAVLTGTGTGRSYRYSGGQATRETAFRSSFFLGFIAVFLFALGVLIDYLT
jgi:hypothetical protein